MSWHYRRQITPEDSGFHVQVDVSSIEEAPSGVLLAGDAKHLERQFWQSRAGLPRTANLQGQRGGSATGLRPGLRAAGHV